MAGVLLDGDALDLAAVLDARAHDLHVLDVVGQLDPHGVLLVGQVDLVDEDDLLVVFALAVPLGILVGVGDGLVVADAVFAAPGLDVLGGDLVLAEVEAELEAVVERNLTEAFRFAAKVLNRGSHLFDLLVCEPVAHTVRLHSGWMVSTRVFADKVGIMEISSQLQRGKRLDQQPQSNPEPVEPS